MNDQVIFYTTHCPQCRVLERKLRETGIEYTECDNVDKMLALALQSAPALGVNGELLNLKQALAYLRGVENRQ